MRGVDLVDAAAAVDDRGADEAVGGQAVAAAVDPEPPGQGEPCGPDGGTGAGGDRAASLGQCGVDGVQAGTGAHDRLGVTGSEDDIAQAPRVDDERPGGRRRTDVGVPAGATGDAEPVVTGEGHARGHVTSRQDASHGSRSAEVPAGVEEGDPAAVARRPRSGDAAAQRRVELGPVAWARAARRGGSGEGGCGDEGECCPRAQDGAACDLHVPADVCPTGVVGPYTEP